MDVAPHADSRFSTTPDWSVPAKRNLRVAVYIFSGESPIAAQDRGIVAFACDGFREARLPDSSLRRQMTKVYYASSA